MTEQITAFVTPEYIDIVPPLLPHRVYNVRNFVMNICSTRVDSPLLVNKREREAEVERLSTTPKSNNLLKAGIVNVAKHF